VHQKGGFGRKINKETLIYHREQWIKRVAKRREEADNITALQMAGLSYPIPTTKQGAEEMNINNNKALLAYVETLPNILKYAYDKARPMWDSGITADMNQGAYDVIDVLIHILIHLSSWLPQNHFDGMSAEEHFRNYIQSRYAWHRALAEPDGIGSGGTIVGTLVAGGVLADLENAVSELVYALTIESEDFEFDKWQRAWKEVETIC